MRSGRLARWAGRVLLGLVALFFVGRAVVEVLSLDYANPASYREDWGGPSLPGVLLVHCGPGLLIVLGFVSRRLGWWRRGERT